jgi:hypothetical protein
MGDQVLPRPDPTPAQCHGSKRHIDINSNIPETVLRQVQTPKGKVQTSVIDLPA